MIDVDRLFSTVQTNLEERYCVYCHINKINGKRYIGQTVYQDNPYERWRTSGGGYVQSSRFYNAIQKYGWDAFDHYIIQDNLTKEEANELEILNIAFYNTTDPKYGYNLSVGGYNGCFLGRHHSEETKQKMSDAHRGYVTSEETKKKISKVKTGVKRGSMSEEQKQKISNTMKGKRFSEEHKQKISMSTIGRQNVLGRIWVHNNNEQKIIPPEQLNDYLSLGWVKGRLKVK